MPRAGTPFIHPKMVDATGRFERAAIIERVEETTSDFGDISKDWVTKHDDIPAVIATTSGQGEVRRADDTIVMDAWTVMLQGDFEDITPKHRVVIEDVAYDIIRVERASVGHLTRLTVERVT